MNLNRFISKLPVAGDKIQGMRQGGKIRVILADDHPLMREGLAAVINAQSDMEVVAEAGDGPAAVRAFSLHHPDVLVMDLRLPLMDGVQATEAIRKEYPRARVLVLTTYLTDQYIYDALRAGAQGYLLKTTERSELLNSIRRIHMGLRCISPEIKNRMKEDLTPPNLTSREMEVLHLIVKGLSNKEIANGLKITESTVKYHIGLIISKLGVSDRTQAAIAALQRGLISEPL